MKKKAQQAVSEEDFTAPSDITPAYMQEKYRQGRGFTFFCVLVFASLCGLAWLYSHYSYLRYFKPGVAAFNQRHYSAAEHDFRSYLHLENDPDGHYFLGRTLLAEGKTVVARAEFLQDGTRLGRGRYGDIWLPNSRSAPYLRQK